MRATVSDLFIYPIKSAQGICVDQAEVSERGFKLDRRWMLVDEEGEFLSQRSFPRLALVEPSFENELLTLRNPEALPLTLPSTPDSTDQIRVEVWGDQCHAIRVSEAADTWFSDFLDVSCSLVYMPDSTRRRVDQDFSTSEDLVSFADGFPFLLVGQSSLDDLNRRLDDPVPMNRFRPNIVVSGTEPFAEDNWDEIRIGSVDFTVAKPCSRCTVTTVDQESGDRGKEPLRTLASYRRSGDKVLFGQNLIHQNRGRIRVDDPVDW
jgi:hypothetical protein